MSVDLYKRQYDPEMLEKQKLKIESNHRIFKLYNKQQINKSVKHINDEMDKAAEDFYKVKKDDGLSL